MQAMLPAIPRPPIAVKKIPKGISPKAIERIPIIVKATLATSQPMAAPRGLFDLEETGV